MGPGFTRLYSPLARPCRQLTSRGGRFSSTPSRASRARHPPSPSASEVAGRRRLRRIARRTRPGGACPRRSGAPTPHRDTAAAQDFLFDSRVRFFSPLLTRAPIESEPPPKLHVEDYRFGTTCTKVRFLGQKVRRVPAVIHVDAERTVLCFHLNIHISSCCSYKVHMYIYIAPRKIILLNASCIKCCYMQS
jgi:hypothetical protein